MNYLTKTITVDGSITWTQNQGISLAYEETAPDLGAYEYVEGGVVEKEYPIAVFPNSCRVYMNENNVTFSGLVLESTIKVYSILGRLVHESGIITQPTYTWHVKGISSGLYFYVIKSSHQPKETTGKIIVIR